MFHAKPESLTRSGFEKLEDRSTKREQKRSETESPFYVDNQQLLLQAVSMELEEAR